MQVFGKQAAQHRAQDAAGHPDAAEIGLVLAALTRADHVGDHGLHHRHDAAAAEPLQAAGEDQHRQARRQRAQHGAGHEQAERNDDHDAPAVDVAERSEHRRDGGCGQEIGGDHPGEIGDVAELAAQRRQRGCDDGLFQRGQEHRQQQAHQNGADLALVERRRRRERRRVRKVDHFGRDMRDLFGSLVGQNLLVGSSTALPFKIAHLRQFVRCAEPRAGESFSSDTLGGNSALRHPPTCMGASRERILARL